MPAPPEEIPVAVAREVEGDAIEPGGQRGIAAEPAQSAIGADKGILRDFFRVSGIPQKIESQPVDPAAIARDDFIEGGFVAGDEPLHKAGIDGSFGRLGLLIGDISGKKLGTKWNGVR